MFSHYCKHEWKSIISLSTGRALVDNPKQFDHRQCHWEETCRVLGAVILRDVPGSLLFSKEQHCKAPSFIFLWV